MRRHYRAPKVAKRSVAGVCWYCNRPNPEGWRGSSIVPACTGCLAVASRCVPTMPGERWYWQLALMYGTQTPRAVPVWVRAAPPEVRKGKAIRELVQDMVAGKWSIHEGRWFESNLQQADGTPVLLGAEQIELLPVGARIVGVETVEEFTARAPAD